MSIPSRSSSGLKSHDVSGVFLVRRLSTPRCRRKCNGCTYRELGLARLEAVLVLLYENCLTLLSDTRLNVLGFLLIRPLCVPDAEAIASEHMSSPVAPPSL